jgi:general nucleoside transport system ATP-binding protein
MNFALETQNLKKYFGSVKANDGIDLAVKPGSIHAICGENGAGKSTLVNQLCGIYQPDEGSILLEGNKTIIDSPKDAFQKGIGILHQHFMLVEAFTALENILLGAEPKSKFMLKRNQGRKEIEAIMETYSLQVPLDSTISQLPVGVQQRIEIIKILYRGAKVIVLDEPTAVLTPQEIQSLFQIMRILRDRGCSIIFISHKLKEVMEVADTVTVIRDGRTIQTWPVEEVNEKILANTMVGRDVLLDVKKKPFIPSEQIVLELNDFTVNGKGTETGVERMSLTVQAGEIFGVIGVAGNGQEALVEGILGIRNTSSGTIKLLGEDITGKIPTDYRSLSIGCIPSDRLKEGLIKEFSVRDNAYLGYQKHPDLLDGPFFGNAKIKHWTDEIVQNNNVKTPNNEALITSLSGGNQQKLIIGRELYQKPKLIVAVQPTRGVDIGSIEFIYENLLAHRDQKAAIFLVSQELEEVLSLSDRIAVIFEGRLMGIGKPTDFTKEEIGLMMAGISAEKGGEKVG